MDIFDTPKTASRNLNEVRLILAQAGSSVSSSVDAVAKPTFPYDGPFEIGVTSSAAPSVVNLSLTSDNQNPSVNDTFKVSVTISSGSTSIKSYKVQLTYDKTLVDVIDSDSVATGVQVKVIDTFFTVKTNSVNSTTGVIILEATTANANTVNRKVGEINFRVKKAGTFLITKDSSNTVAVNTANTSIPLNYQSLSLILGTQVSESTTTAATTISTVTESAESSAGDLPATALSQDTVSILATVFAATLLIILGFSATIRSKRSSFSVD